MPVSKGQAGVRQEMHKFKEGTLHSGSSKGPVVKSRKQAVAIAMHQAGLSNRNPGHHGGFEMAKTGQRASKPAPARAGAAPSAPQPRGLPNRGGASARKLAAGGTPRSAMYGGPPADGFHRVAPPAGTAVKSTHAKYEHLGRFSTGKPRPGVSRSTAVRAGANR